MNYRIDSLSEKPAYIQLYEMLRKDIISYTYKAGEKLPSKRNVAEDVGVSVITVAHAYELLCDEGYVEAREKSGYYVNYKTDDFYVVSGKSDNNKDEILLDSNISDIFQEPQKIYTHGAGELSFNIMAKTARKVLLEYGEKILEKSSNKGIEELRYEVAKYLARSVGIHANPSQIVVGAGAEYLYGLVAQLFDDVKTVAVEKPCYEKIKKVYERFSYDIDELELGKEGIISSELLSSRAGLLHITPFHSFPSNISASISKKNEYLKWAGENKYIVEDNYDSELTISRKMEDTVFSLSKGKNVIFINTFSKTIAPSIRVGYMVLPENLLDKFNEKLGFYSCTVPVLEQYILMELLKNGDFERHINKVRRKQRQKVLSEKK